jgi:hypothetical protein
MSAIAEPPNISRAGFYLANLARRKWASRPHDLHQERAMIDDYAHEIGGVQFQHFPQAPKPTGFRKNRVVGGAHFAPQLLHRDVWVGEV